MENKKNKLPENEVLDMHPAIEMLYHKDEQRCRNYTGAVGLAYELLAIITLLITGLVIHST